MVKSKACSIKNIRLLDQKTNPMAITKEYNGVETIEKSRYGTCPRLIA